ncbi:MAG: NAD-dependent epimerase/dehydratase family protein [Anaerolineae bacterium]|jgi:nucleoside-diphosphate-sugar epimerase|nr:NAD-dependent epimerase/dehydratase family protein [Anaerolineae bacterium]
MRYLVTGAAGFIGSHLCEALLGQGHEVIGVDGFIPYYPRPLKEQNLLTLHTHSGKFRFHECDLRTDDLDSLLDGVEVVYHLAAMAGLLASWVNFEQYMTCNVLATQRLLESVRRVGGLRQVIHASTSSVYGSQATGDEDSPLNPVSPYGITKLAAEHLVRAYERQFGIPTTILRYFSVYGPRQRPDMGYQIFINAILKGEPITVLGDGTQRRASTYISDIVRGSLLASEHFTPGAIYNLGGADETSLNELIEILEEIIGLKAVIQHGAKRPGEQDRAVANTDRALQSLGYAPEVSLVDGLRQQVSWNRDQRD